MKGRARQGRSRHLGTALRFGAFVVVCLVLLVALAQRIGNLSLFSHRVTYEAQLSDATGLQPSDSVKIAGVTVGQVTAIGVQRGHALVTFAVNSGVHLRTSTKAGLRWHNVLGQQYLYLYPGATGTALRPGGVIPLANDVASASVGALLNALGPFLSAVNPQQANTFLRSVVAALDGNEAKVNSLIADAATVSQTVGSLDSQVGQVIGDLDQVLTALAHRSGDIGTLLSNLQSVAQTLASHNALLDSVVTNLASVTGEFAGLVRSNQGTLQSSIADLQSVTSVVQAHEAALSQGLSTLGSGLAPYAEISAFGQWFQIQTVYTCMAGETSCTYINPSNPPAGSAPGGAALPGGLGTPGTSPLSMLQMVAGAGSGS